MIETTKPSLKEKQWQLREDAILEATSELMTSKGYNAMTMDDVANLVGISKATLYQHFSSKHDLVVSVACTLDRAFERMSAIDQSLSPSAKLSQLIEGIVDVRYGQESPPFFEAMGELIEVLGTDHPFMLKERRNVKFILDTTSEAASAGDLLEGVAVLVAVHVIIGTLRCVDLEKAIAEGHTNTQEIASSVKHMLLKQPA